MPQSFSEATAPRAATKTSMRLSFSRIKEEVVSPIFFATYVLSGRRRRSKTTPARKARRTCR
eukprot:scaffold4592_cov169-Ochromonas_danica.AAC.2